MMQQPGFEKPMTQLGTRSFIERVVVALKGIDSFEKIVAAVSPTTPATKKFLLSVGIETIDTSGTGYPQDLSMLLEKLAPAKVLVVPADLPLLTAGIMRKIVDILAEACNNEGVPALSVAIEKSFVEKLGVTPSVYFGNNLCHSGITLFDTSSLTEGATDRLIEEHYVIMNRVEVSLNVNTKKEKEIAESLIKRANNLA